MIEGQNPASKSKQLGQHYYIFLSFFHIQMSHTEEAQRTRVSSLKVFAGDVGWGLGRRRGVGHVLVGCLFDLCFHPELVIMFKGFKPFCFSGGEASK